MKIITLTAALAFALYAFTSDQPDFDALAMCDYMEDLPSEFSATKAHLAGLEVCK